MKRPQEWEEEDLQEMILDQHDESIELDFKGADALGRSDGKKTEISKDVSAFANSAGGTILYGMDEDPSPPYHAAALSPIDPREFTKEWLEQVINSRIQPRIEGIVIKPIELAKSASGKFAYVVEIPESTTCHQAYDKRYYKRFNFQSVPMEDYEVRQTMNRASRPAYSIRLQVVGVRAGDNMRVSGFQAMVQNESEIVGHDVAAVLFLPSELIQPPDDFTWDFDGIPYSRIPGTYTESSGGIRSAVTSAHPLTPYAIYFSATISYKTDFYLRTRITAIVRVYDKFGLALRASFHVSMSNLDVSSVEQNHANKRLPARIVL